MSNSNLSQGFIRRICAQHGLDPVCMWLVAQFVVRPLLALRAYIRQAARAGSVEATTAEHQAHGIMLALFCVPGIPWSLALVLRGQPDRVTAVLAAAVVRWDAQDAAARADQQRILQAARSRLAAQRFMRVSSMLGAFA